VHGEVYVLLPEGNVVRAYVEDMPRGHVEKKYHCE
jgi:hypothetical protein